MFAFVEFWYCICLVVWSLSVLVWLCNCCGLVRCWFVVFGGLVVFCVWLFDFVFGYFGI